jgi:tetratricopeptide (TPR) repeat protein
VESVLEGIYQRSSDVIRVTVQLIDGRTGTLKWSQRYDLHSADILTFEDQVAAKVVEGLQIEISPREQESIQEAEEELRRLVAKNPDQFKALAYFGSVLYYEGKLDEAKTNLDRAVLLARNSGDDTS